MRQRDGGATLGGGGERAAARRGAAGASGRVSGVTKDCGTSSLFSIAPHANPAPPAVIFSKNSAVQLPLDLRNPTPGVPKPIVPQTASLRERFLAKIDPQPSGCWRWLGYHYKNGYAGISWKHSGKPAHRIAWLLFRGPLPSGHSLTIDHLCRHRWCVNPDHLEIVPMHVNQERGLNPFLNAKRRVTGRVCGRGHAVPDDAERCPTCRRDHARAYRAKHPDTVRERQRAYRQQHPEQFREYYRQYRARKRSAP